MDPLRRCAADISIAYTPYAVEESRLAAFRTPRDCARMVRPCQRLHAYRAPLAWWRSDAVGARPGQIGIRPQGYGFNAIPGTGTKTRAVTAVPTGQSQQPVEFLRQIVRGGQALGIDMRRGYAI